MMLEHGSKNKGVLMAIALVALFTGLLLLFRPWAGKDTNIDEVNAVDNVVKTFGQKMKNVSLLSPTAAQDIEANYGDLLDPALLALWKKDPLTAVGRTTSSPWPERIEITTARQLSTVVWDVEANIIDVSGTGVSGSRPVKITVTKFDDKYLITGVAITPKNDLENLPDKNSGMEKQDDAPASSTFDSWGIIKEAIGKKDASICGQIPLTVVVSSEPDVIVRDSCIAQVAEAVSDPSICGKTSDPDSVTTALCYYETAIVTNDVSACAKASRKADGYGASIVSPRDDCYLTIAVALKDASICENTSLNGAHHLSSSDRSKCYYQVAVAKKDVSICDKITPDMIQTYSGSEDTSKEACRAAVLREQACEGLPIPKVEGLTYHKARIEIIKSGWRPLQTNSDDNELSGQAKNFFDAGYKEVDDCAGTGKAYCRFLFKDSCANIIKVVTAGEEIPKLNAFAAVEGITVMTEKEKAALGL
ncbi:MAG: hypothetical protein MUD10_02310 [Candidatus Pacebacteria bacterium]|jgi:hypothetical protein|nr:hypothetical protein [Candidatus Paceibacterota bacterium]